VICSCQNQLRFDALHCFEIIWLELRAEQVEPAAQTQKASESIVLPFGKSKLAFEFAEAIRRHLIKLDSRQIDLSNMPRHNAKVTFFDSSICQSAKSMPVRLATAFD
jgi:hypothetical protein